MADWRDTEVGDVWTLDTSDEQAASYSLNEVVDAAFGGDRKAQSYLSRLWDGERWPSIKKKLETEGSVWQVWWMDGARQHAQNYLAGRVYVP